MGLVERDTVIDSAVQEGEGAIVKRLVTPEAGIADQCLWADGEGRTE